jgi:nitrite reductase/ring-hydroxylating ferredoxin subunit
MVWHFVCHIKDFPVNETRGIKFEANKKDFAFIVHSDSGLYAWRNACPHLGYEGTSMAWKRDRYLNGDKQYILCAAHGAKFEIDSGLGISDPCQGKSLIAIPLKVDEDGNIYWLQE